MPGARDLLMFVCMRLILYWLSEAPEARFHVIVMRRKAESLQEAEGACQMGGLVGCPPPPTTTQSPFLNPFIIVF